MDSRASIRGLSWRGLLFKQLLGQPALADHGAQRPDWHILARMRHDDRVPGRVPILRMAPALGHKAESILRENADERLRGQRWAMRLIKDQATANSPTVTWEITGLLSSGKSSK